jgi:hypothetical protein
MRVKDILKETSIFTRDSYSYGHLVKVAGSEKGLDLIDKIQKVIPDFDPSEKLEWVDETPDVETTVLFGRASHLAHGGNMRYFKRPNGEVFAIAGSDKTIQGALNHADKFNRGDIAEGILGAAITAKLVKRGSDKIGQVSADDVMDILGNALGKSKQSLDVNVKDKNSMIADEIQFKLRLPGPSLEAISDKKMWPQFKDLFNSAVHYVNGPDADRYSNYFYINGKTDKVFINSDGVSGQKERKTDIQVLVKTTDPVTGKEEERNLKNVDISLKADSIKYGQSSSGGLQQTPEVWLQKANKVFGPLGIEIDMPPKKLHKDMLLFWTQIYHQAAKKLNHVLESASANKETTFIEKIADVIQLHGAGASPTVRLVSFHKGTSSIHAFNVLKNRLISKNIQLGAKCFMGARSGKPTLSIYDKTTKELLTNIRFYLTDSASTNYFEKGPLLHELTKISKEPVQQALASQPEQPAPVQQPPEQPAPVQQPPEQQEPQPEQPVQQTPDELEQIKRNAGIQQPA